MVLRGVAPIASGEVSELVVIYPDTFPHTRISIYAPKLRLARHQNPLETNLCALPRGSGYWRPSMLAAEVVETQVPDLVRLARSADPSQSAAEYPQGEPASAYYPYLPTGGILVPEQAFILGQGACSGSMRIAFDPDDAWLTESPGEPVAAPLLGVGALVSLKDRRGAMIVEAGELAQNFVGTEWNGRWVQLAEAPMTLDLGEFIRHLAEVDPSLNERRWALRGAHHVELVGVAFPEEVRQNVWETGWMFLVLHPEGKRTMGGRFLRAMRYSEDHVAERLGVGAPLRDKRVGVAGVGALGAPICLQLAMSLVGELRPLDPDYVDPATSVRWPAGVRAAGASKTLYLKAEIQSQYPLTKVEAFTHMIGAAPRIAGESEARILERWLQDVDLVIDASAEDNVSRAIAHLSHPAGIAQVYVWSIEGYGGVVARIEPGRTGCYLCLERALSEGHITPPSAPEQPRRVQPRGCSDPTFVAPYVDLAPLSVEAARAAISELSKDEGDYPPLPYDVLVFRIRNPDGGVVPPSWEPSTLMPYEGCALCDAAS